MKHSLWYVQLALSVVKNINIFSNNKIKFIIIATAELNA